MSTRDATAIQMTSTPETLEPPDDWDDEPEDDDDDLYLDEDCGMGPDGQCSMAGSEWCDWDCPLERQALRRKQREQQK